VKSFRWAGIQVQPLYPYILIVLLVIAPRVGAVLGQLWQARLDLQAGSPQAGARHLALAAEMIPWRTGLLEQAGRVALNDGSAQAAARFLEQAASLGALSPGGMSVLGDVYWQVGDTEAALCAWQEALNARAPDPGIYRRLALAYQAEGDYEMAIADLLALAAIQPADAQLRYQLGMLLAALEPEDALAHLAQAAELDPGYLDDVSILEDHILTARLAGDRAYTLMAAGRALASLSRWELAAEAFRQATLARPDYADAWAYLGEALQHLEEEVGSSSPGSQAAPPGLSELKKALALDPNSLAANTLLAIFWQRQDRYDRALEVLQPAAMLHPRNPALQAELGNTQAVLGNLPAAQEAYEKAVRLSPHDPAALRLLASFSIRYEYLVRQVGLPAARKAVLLAPEDPASLDLMAQALILLGDALNAERFLRRAIEADPDFAPARLHLGWASLLKKDNSIAAENLRLAQSLAPDTPTAAQAQRLLDYYFP
jgi:tetratricopeptide (TPR) repeat protein